MTTASNRTGYNDPWSLANALVGLFTFTVPKQTDRSSGVVENLGRSSTGSEVDEARESVTMRHAESRQVAGGSSASSPTDQPPATIYERSQVSPSQSLPGINEQSVICWAMNKVETGTPVNRLELFGLQNFLQKLHEPREGTIEPEVLDLTGSSTPSPGPSCAAPRNGPSFTTSSSLPSISNGAKPRKMLQRNPNGVLHWRGAGSARSRSGAKSRVVRPADAPSEQRENRVKRRRLTEGRDEGETMSGLPPSKSAPVIGSNETAAGMSLPTNLADIQKLPRATIRPASIPSVPSPLRQVTTTGSASPESRGLPLGRNSATGIAHQRTHAATVLTELIESVTPPPRLTIDNPYQTEAPVKPDYKPKTIKRMTERREELSRKEKDKEKEQDKAKEKNDYSAKSIIEATVPKGVKRSRPSLPGSKPQVPNGVVDEPVDGADDELPAKKRQHVTVEDADDVDDVRRKSQEQSSSAPPKKPQVVVEVVDDGDEQPAAGVSSQSSDGIQNQRMSSRSTSPLSSAPKTPSFFGVPKHSAKPKEPSKLRTSIVPEEDDTSTNGPPYPSILGSVLPAASAVFSQRKAATASGSSTAPKASALPPVAAALPNTAPARTKSGDDLSVSVPTQNADSAKDAALRKNKDSLPVYHFEISVKHFGPQYADAQKAALSKRSSELPKFDFDKPLSVGANSTSQLKLLDLKSVSGSSSPNAPPVAAPAKAPVQTFDWTAAGLAPKPSVTGGSWTCGTCMLSNPASAMDKCTVCESPR